MQFNLVNDQEQVVQFVRRSVALRDVSVRVLRGVPEAFCSAGVLLGCGALAQGVFGQL